MDKTLNENNRAPQEYRLVTDGKQLYRLSPHYKIPKGVHEVFTHFGEKVYQSNGRLKPKFIGLQRIQPRNNIKHLNHCILTAIYGNNYNAS